MEFIRQSINKPVTVAVGVIFIVLFGVISLYRLPYQLTPDVLEPEITIDTVWRGATPYEVEREIIEEQEEVLKGIPGLVEMESDSLNGRGTVTLRFKIGTDVDDALLRVSNKINEVLAYPEDVEKPVITATGAATSPAIWIVMKAQEGNERSASTYRSFFDNEVRQHLERVPGVADLFIGGGTRDEMHVIVEPSRLAAYGLTVGDLISALASENVNVSAGNMGVGRRDFRVRTTAEFKSEADLEGMVVRSTGQKRVLLGDIAEVKRGHEKKRAHVIQNGEEGIAIGVKPEPGTNVLEMTDRVYETVEWLNETKMHPEGVHLHWVYDQRGYIRQAIDLIKEDIAIGGVLAAAVLLIFIGSVRSTIVVATTIPISIIGTFIFMSLLGRNLNVVSLSGMAFSVGIFIDNAIVVIDNIDRHRGMGKSAFLAAYDGAREVWGAILASSLTNIAVFLPVVFMKEEAGQLFRDIAIAMVFAVTISLFVSISVIPMYSRRIFARGAEKKTRRDVLAGFGGRASRAIMAVVGWSLRTWKNRVATVVALVSVAVLSTYALMPKMEYLPQGNRNLIINLLVPPPGLSQDEMTDIGEKFFEMADPYIGKKTHEGLPGIENMFFVGSEFIMLSGVISTQETRAAELLPLLQRMIFSIPGMYGVSMQAGIFQTRLGRGRTIEVDLSGGDINRIAAASGMMFGRISEKMPDAQVRPVPSIELTYPEVRIKPDRDRLKANGMSSSDLGVVLDVLMDGRDVGDFKEEGKKKVDLVLKASEEEIKTPEVLYGSVVSTPGGKLIPVSSLAGLERTSGLNQIRHLERNRTITLQVTPSEAVPLQAAMELIEGEVIKPMQEQGMLEGVSARMSGAADKLTETRQSLQWNFLLAALITYLLMAALYENFLYPFIIMLTVPLAGAGGFIGLSLLNIFIAPQPMDILTMLGFVILIGVVVNNAILIVHQALNNVRFEGMGHMEAVMDSTRTRLRPIYMSATVSFFGMVPLVLFPGAGSELYRGLGSVLLGGIAISTVFTVFMIPPLLMFVIGREKKASDAEGERSQA